MDCFISYTSVDVQMARLIKERLEQQNISTFMAELSLTPGSKWTDQIKNVLNSSSWVIYLASRNACHSSFVQQEVGAAIFGNQTVVPEIWDIEPDELPGWSSQFQVLDLRKIIDLDDSIKEIA